jgi:hypothetical protein
MSREELKEYWPDTAAEWQKIGTYINHLGSSMSGILLFSASKGWVVASLFLTWFGTSLADYFGTNLKMKKHDEPGTKI